MDWIQLGPGSDQGTSYFYTVISTRVSKTRKISLPPEISSVPQEVLSSVQLRQCCIREDNDK
jgi:hypothetical protein